MHFDGTLSVDITTRVLEVKQPARVGDDYYLQIGVDLGHTGQVVEAFGTINSQAALDDWSMFVPARGEVHPVVRRVSFAISAVRDDTGINGTAVSVEISEIKMGPVDAEESFFVHTSTT